jgi:hypothetical protein
MVAAPVAEAVPVAAEVAAPVAAAVPVDAEVAAPVGVVAAPVGDAAGAEVAVEAVLGTAPVAVGAAAGELHAVSTIAMITMEQNRTDIFTFIRLFFSYKNANRRCVSTEQPERIYSCLVGNSTFLISPLILTDNIITEKVYLFSKDFLTAKSK